MFYSRHKHAISIQYSRFEWARLLLTTAPTTTAPWMAMVQGRTIRQPYTPVVIDGGGEEQFQQHETDYIGA